MPRLTMAFGEFDGICLRASIPLCALIASGDDLFGTGIVSKCYARSVDIANTVIFQVGNTFINIGALALIVLILFNIKNKFTAIGRLEMMHFYFTYFLLTALSIVNDCGVAPPGSVAYGWLVAAQNGLTSASCWLLTINGLLGFEFWEDGKRQSLLFLRISTFLAFVLTFVISIFTFKNWSLIINKDKTLALFVVLYIVNAVLLAVYVLSQILLCLYVLNNAWALGATFLAVFFFVVGQILIYVLSNIICTGVNHYLDGLFFGTLCNTLAVMMLYKYWDMITAEDLEFSVNSQETGVNVYYGDK